jgi:hypothetical protein
MHPGPLRWRGFKFFIISRGKDGYTAGIDLDHRGVRSRRGCRWVDVAVLHMDICIMMDTIRNRYPLRHRDVLQCVACLWRGRAEKWISGNDG